MNGTTSKLSQREGKIWFDGKLVDWQDANIHVLTHCLHYGTGVFEGVRCYDTKKGPAIFKLAEHTKRLFNSAKIIGMDIPFSYDDIYQAQLDTVVANDLSDAYIRPLVFYDDTELGISVVNHGVKVIIASWPWGAYLGKEGLERGIDVCVSSFRRPDVSASMIHAKVTGNYINSVLAKQEALKGGYSEALLLDKEGYLSEGSGENIFMIIDGKLVTPTVDSALNGITRKTIMDLAKEMGIEIEVRRIARDEIYTADEAFFTGTAAEVTPIKSVDKIVIGNSKRGSLTEKLQSKYFACVKGERADADNYLSYINAKQCKVA